MPPFVWCSAVLACALAVRQLVHPAVTLAQVFLGWDFPLGAAAAVAAGLAKEVLLTPAGRLGWAGRHLPAV